MKTNTNRIHRKGASKAAKSQAKIPAEFKIIRLRECPVDAPLIENPPQIIDFWRKHIAIDPRFKDDRECLYVFLLNTRKHLIGFELVSQGNLTTILFHPRDVFRMASIYNAAGIIIAHNHPSGDPDPSEADIKITRDLIRAAAMMKIEFVDHVIIGDARREKPYSSLRELGLFYADGPSKKGAKGGKTKAVREAYSLGDLEQTTNKVVCLIDLFEAKLSSFVRDRVNPKSPDFSPVASCTECGIMLFADEVKKELVDGVAELFWAKIEVAA